MEYFQNTLPHNEIFGVCRCDDSRFSSVKFVPFSPTKVHQPKSDTEDLARNLGAKNCAVPFAAFGCECLPQSSSHLGLTSDLWMFTAGFILGECESLKPPALCQLPPDIELLVIRTWAVWQGTTNLGRIVHLLRWTCGLPFYANTARFLESLTCEFGLAT